MRRDLTKYYAIQSDDEELWVKGTIAESFTDAYHKLKDIKATNIMLLTDAEMKYVCNEFKKFEEGD